MQSASSSVRSRSFLYSRIMERRAFLALSALAATITPLTSGCATPARAAPPAPSPRSATNAPHADLEEATLADLSARMEKGELTSRALVEAYLARIDAIDRAGPKLRAVIETNSDALAIASALDERRAKGARGPLHGIPILLKDNIGTGDRMLTTAGSFALAGAPATKDSAVAARLRAAGAVILGKSNLSEWAMARSTNGIGGWSARGGRAKNPYCLDRTTSGSSSGSASGVAANLAAIAVGTETMGSIMSPSSINGVVGIKPTVGLVSRAGVIPITRTQDTAGPIARTVADAAALLTVLAGADPNDPATAGAPAPRDYAKVLDPNGARGARIGVLRGQDWLTPGIKAAFEAALDALRAGGAVLVDVDPLRNLDEMFPAAFTVMQFELRATMAAYLATRTEQSARTLDDLIRFNDAHAGEEMRWFGQEIFKLAAARGGLDSPDYTSALATCARIARDEGIDAALAKDRLDALVAPTGGVAWRTDRLNSHNMTGSSAPFPAIARYPNITVPCGDVSGLPLGVCFFAGAWAEPTLLRIAYAYEQATKMRRAPRFVPTLDDEMNEPVLAFAR
jgi:amidase